MPGVIPEAVRAAARHAPDHWIGVVDPEWTEDRTPPEWAVVGEWRSAANGTVGSYRANPAYRPSPRTLGWPEPTDPVDTAAQRAATGYGSVHQALSALATAEVTFVSGADGAPLPLPGRDGTPVVLAFTSPAHAFLSTALSHATLPGAALARAATGLSLLVNAGAAAPLFVPADAVPGTGTDAVIRAGIAEQTDISVQAEAVVLPETASQADGTAATDNTSQGNSATPARPATTDRGGPDPTGRAHPYDHPIASSLPTSGRIP